MRWRAEVRVVLRDGIADPEGQTIAGGLGALGFEGIEEVRTGKLIILSLDAPDEGAAGTRVEEMCRRLLANPVIETFSYDVRREPPSSDVAA